MSKVIDLQVVYMDERLSTKRAEEVMREMKMSHEDIKDKSDAKAASVILQDYIDYNN